MIGRPTREAPPGKALNVLLESRLIPLTVFDMTRDTFRAGALVGSPLAAGILSGALVAAIRGVLNAGTLLGAGFHVIVILITAVLVSALAFALLRSVWSERIGDGCVVVSYWHGGSTLAIPIADIHSWIGPVESNPFLPESLRLLWYTWGHECCGDRTIEDCDGYRITICAELDAV